MKVCYTAGPVKKLENCFSVSTNAVEIRIWFLTDDILRIRAGFDGDWDEASYSLTMTAWDSRTDELMKDCRKRVQTAALKAGLLPAVGGVQAIGMERSMIGRGAVIRTDALSIHQPRPNSKPSLWTLERPQALNCPAVQSSAVRMAGELVRRPPIRSVRWAAVCIAWLWAKL